MGSFYILTAIFLWSSLGIFVRLSGVPVHTLIFYSALVSVILQGAAIALKGDYGMFLKGKNRFFLLVVGPVSLLNTGSFFYAFKLTTIANAVMTHYIAPVVVAFLAPVFLKEATNRKIMLSIVIASAGLWVLLGSSPDAAVESLRRPSKETAGIISGLFSGLIYGLFIIMIRAYARSFTPLVMCFSQNLIICLILLPFAGGAPLGAIWIFIFMGAVHYTIAPLIYFKGMRHVSANRAAVLGYLEPVSAIIIGMIFLGEYPSALSLVGGVMILFAGYLIIKAGYGNEN
jgi:drug/metabolite transporter (DMT)-like permease